jgi:hypothetical protein
MADTRYLKSIVEDHIRAWLKDKFGQSFASTCLPLIGVQGIARTHEFDAVSEDGTIVCSIKTASWKTSGKKRGSGKVQGAYTELYFFSLVQATQKILILTDPEFFECFTRETSGRLTNEVALLHCPLRRWCWQNRNRFYIPEWLLEEWHITVDPNVAA